MENKVTTEIEETDVLKHQLEELQKEMEAKDIRISQMLKSQQRTESEELGELFTSLAKAQGEMRVATKSGAINAHFKSEYATIDDVVRASRNALTKHGLSIIQYVKNGSHSLLFCSRLCHASGQWIEARMNFNQEKPGIQGFGAALTYLRRYSYISMFCVALADDELDDDGESGRQALEDRDIAAKIEKAKRITREQLDVLSSEIAGDEALLESIVLGYKIEKLAELPKEKYEACLKGIRKNNAVKNMNNN